MKKPMVDGSRGIIAIHQNHDYRHHPRGKHAVWYEEETGANYKLVGGWNHLRTIADSSEVRRADGLKPNSERHRAAVKRYVREAGRVVLYNIAQPIWFFLLGIARPLRNALGLRAAAVPRTRGKVFRLQGMRA